MRIAIGADKPDSTGAGVVAAFSTTVFPETIPATTPTSSTPAAASTARRARANMTFPGGVVVPVSCSYCSFATFYIATAVDIQAQSTKSTNDLELYRYMLLDLGSSSRLESWHG